MATTLAEDTRDIACNAIVDAVDVGAGDEGTLYITKSDNSVLVTIPLENPAFGAANAGALAAGVAEALGLPLSAIATGAGTAAKFFVHDCDDDEVWQGTVGGTAQATTGDLQLASSVIGIGDNVEITDWTFTVPAS